MTITLLAIFAVAAFLSFALTPLVIRLAVFAGALDQPDERKVHKSPTPRLGGVAVVASFFLTMIGLRIAMPSFDFSFWLGAQRGIAVAVSMVLVLALGVWDDIRTLKAGPKFLAQVAIGTIVYAAGFRLSAIAHPFTEGMLDLGMFDYPATILWITGITNALNLIDGLDGLAAGVSLIAAMTVVAVSLTYHDPQTALIAIAVAGAVLGFLRHNFYPAKIFLGDSGSLFLGFMLALLTLHIPTKKNTIYALLVPALALGIPILDTMLAMARRFLRPFIPGKANSMSPLAVFRSIFLPDRQHIHHQLMAKGYSHPKVVVLLYIASASLGLGAFALSVTENVLAFGVSVILAAGTYYGIRQLGYREIAVHRNGILLQWYMTVTEWPLLKKGWFQSLLDLGFITLSFAVAARVGGDPTIASPMSNPFLFTLIAVSLVQSLSFWATGLYKETTRQLGIGDALRSVRCVVMTSGITAFFLGIASESGWHSITSTVLLDSYFLMMSVLASRFSFSVLIYLLHREEAGKKRVLIYGADYHGMMMLHLILDSQEFNLAPVGFLDEDPALLGKNLNGYPIFGGHWKLHEILRRGKIDEILVPGDGVRPEVLKRMNRVALQAGVPLRKVSLQLGDLGTLEQGAAVAPPQPVPM